MKHQLIARSLGSFSSFRFPFSLQENGDELQHFNESSGLTLSEDQKCIYVEAAVPGIKSEEIEITFENRSLWIRAVKKEKSQNAKKTYHRKAMSSFSYYVSIPADIDETKHLDTICKNGIVEVILIKKKNKEAKKIPIIHECKNS